VFKFLQFLSAELIVQAQRELKNITPTIKFIARCLDACFIWICHGWVWIKEKSKLNKLITLEVNNMNV